MASRFKKLKKRVLRSGPAVGLLGWIASLYVRLVSLTTSFEDHGDEQGRELVRAKQPFIAAFWHNRLMLMPTVWLATGAKVGGRMNMLISSHRDGRFIARTVENFGVSTIAGSSTRGGSSALRGILRALKDGEYIAITPDGPRGPRQRVGGSVIQLARTSGVPIVPVAITTRRRRVLDTWDRLVFSLPFTRGVVVWAKPLWIDRDADEEEARLALERALNDVSRRADELCGREPIEPAPAGPPEPEDPLRGGGG